MYQAEQSISVSSPPTFASFPSPSPASPSAGSAQPKAHHRFPSIPKSSTSPTLSPHHPDCYPLPTYRHHRLAHRVPSPFPNSSISFSKTPSPSPAQSASSSSTTADTCTSSSSKTSRCATATGTTRSPLSAPKKRHGNARLTWR